MSTILHFITGIRQLWYTLKQKLTAATLTETSYFDQVTLQPRTQAL